MDDCQMILGTEALIKQGMMASQACGVRRRGETKARELEGHLGGAHWCMRCWSR